MIIRTVWQLSMRWILDRVPLMETPILDLGGAGSLMALSLPNHVSIDLRPNPELAPTAQTQIVDLFGAGLPEDSLGTCIAHNLLHYLGTGAYDQASDLQAPAKAMALMYSWVKPGGHIFYTLPIGKPTVDNSPSGPVRIFSPDEANRFAGDCLEQSVFFRRVGEGYRLVDPESFEIEAWAFDQPLQLGLFMVKVPETAPSFEDLRLDELPKEATEDILKPWEKQISKARVFHGRVYSDEE